MKKKHLRLPKRRFRPHIVIACGILVLIVLAILIGVRACVQKNDRFTGMAYGVPIYTDLISKDSPARPGTIRTIKYIVIHETGNAKSGSNAAAHSNFLLHNNASTTSWHYTVDDHEIYHHIPDEEVAWHASDKLKNPGGNLNGIGVELCVNEDGDFEKTFDNAARLTAYLLNEYSLGIDAVKQHADFTQKNCPEHIRNDNRMEEFLKLVARYRKSGESDKNS